MAAVLEILPVIFSAAELTLSAKEVADAPAPEPSHGVKDKTRWIQCVVKNETQFDLLMMDTHFDSGRYWDAPGNAGAFKQMTFTACNGDNTIMTGCSGGTHFRVSLDNTVYCDLSLGWTSPYAGTFKASVVESPSAQAGYDAATSEGNSIMSANTYAGKDKDGHQQKFRLHVSASPGQNAIYVISQVMV